MSDISPLSRYFGIATAMLELSDGTTVIHLRRRFVPAPERFALLQWHEVRDGERIDQVAAHYLGDPEQFWRLCDANRALRPAELVDRPGTLLRITLPEGVPGASDG